MSVYDVCPICGVSYLSHGARDTHTKECADKLKAENERLRKALIEVQDMIDGHMADGEVNALLRIVDAALNARKE